MTKKIFLTIILLCNLSYSSTKNIENKINKNKKILNKQSSKQEKTSLMVKELADKIEEQNKNIINLEKDIKKVNSDIEEHQKLLEESQEKLKDLRKKSTILIKEKKGSETQIVDTIVEDFSTSIALKLASKNTLKELIDSEIYTILSENSKDKILQLDNNYDLLSNNTKKNQKNIKKISTYIEKRQKTKDTLKSLKTKHSKSLTSLESQHKSYQKELKKVIQQQESLKQLLSKLNILKEAEIKKERAKQERIRKEKLRKLLQAKKKNKKAKINKKDEEKEEKIITAENRNQQYAKNLNLDVRKIGSSTDGVKIVKYRGRKTIPPLKYFKVVKKFGTYYDPVYKIKLFNESIVLKTKKPKAKVVSVLNGKIVYAKKNAGMLENVVIVQHENGLHTIYSHLDKIAPNLKVGKWVKKGAVVGRVNKNLTFQATKNSYHINPKDLFRI